MFTFITQKFIIYQKIHSQVRQWVKEEKSKLQSFLQKQTQKQIQEKKEYQQTTFYLRTHKQRLQETLDNKTKTFNKERDSYKATIHKLKLEHDATIGRYKSNIHRLENTVIKEKDDRIALLDDESKKKDIIIENLKKSNLDLEKQNKSISKQQQQQKVKISNDNDNGQSMQSSKRTNPKNNNNGSNRNQITPIRTKTTATTPNRFSNANNIKTSGNNNIQSKSDITNTKMIVNDNNNLCRKKQNNNNIATTGSNNNDDSNNHSSGPKKEIILDNGDTISTLKYANGDIKTTYNDSGIVVYYYASHQVCHFLPCYYIFFAIAP